MQEDKYLWDVLGDGWVELDSSSGRERRGTPPEDVAEEREGREPDAQ